MGICIFESLTWRFYLEKGMKRTLEAEKIKKEISRWVKSIFLYWIVY